MFVAWRDLRFARGRFSLIISVVILITMLVGLLSGLMNGLRDQNISAISSLEADRVVFSAPASGSSLSYNDSTISEDQRTAWESASPDIDVQPLGIATARIAANDAQVTASLFGVQSGFDLAPGDAAPASPGEINLPADVAETLHVSTGDTVHIGESEFTVSAVTGDTWFSHTPVAWVNLAAWQEYSATTGNPDATATVLLVNGADSNLVSSLNDAAGTVDQPVSESFNAIGGYQSENGSLMAMLGMLLAISGLVIGAFFIVWTIQRTSDIAILKALGASTWSLVRDALGQAAVVLALGVGIGLALVIVIGQFAAQVVPFVTSLSATVLPGALLVGLGLAGAAFALRIIVNADPLTAIGNNR